MDINTKENDQIFSQADNLHSYLHNIQVSSYVVYLLKIWFHHQWIAISLTHWGRVTHICIGKLTIIGSDNGLSPEQRQAIIWTNAGILLIWPLGTNFN